MGNDTTSERLSNYPSSTIPTTSYCTNYTISMNIEKGVKFEHNKQYIVISEASDEGYIYEIYPSKKDYEKGNPAWDGGQCTSTLSDAIEMALSQA